MKPGKPARRQRLQIKAVSALVTGVVCFFLVQLAFRYLIKTSRPDLRDPTFETKAARFQERLAQTPGAPSVCMFGSSCTVYGFRGMELEEQLAHCGPRPVVFNFGNYGAGPIVHRLYLERLLERGVKPSLVLLEVLPQAFATSHNDLAKLPGTILTRSEIALLQHYGASDDLMEDYRLCRLAPLYGHRLGIISQFWPTLIPHAERMECWQNMDKSGWCPMIEFSEARRREVTEATLQRFVPILKEFKAEGRAWQALEENLMLLANRGIPAMMVVAPESPAQRGAYPAEEVAKLYAKLRGLAEKYKTTIIDAREWFDDADYGDGVHLLPGPALTYTQRLGAQLPVEALAQR